MKILFDTNAPDQTTFNIWILNLSNLKITMKSIKADATPKPAAEVIVESTDKLMEQLRNENENLKQKTNSLELVVNDYKIRDKEQEKKIIDQLSYILSLETEAINLKSTSVLNDNDYLAFNETMDIERLFVYDQDLIKRLEDLEEVLNFERKESADHHTDLERQFQYYIKERNDYQIKYDYQLKLNQVLI